MNLTGTLVNHPGLDRGSCPCRCPLLPVSFALCGRYSFVHVGLPPVFPELVKLHQALLDWIDIFFQGDRMYLHKKGSRELQNLFSNQGSRSRLKLSSNDVKVASEGKVSGNIKRVSTRKNNK